MRKKIIAAVPLLIAMFGVWWLYNHAFIEVVVENADNTSVELLLTDQRHNKAARISYDSKSKKQLVSRSSFEVLVSQNENSHLRIVKTGGFLSTTTVKMKLEPEKLRTFVGDNPSFCTAIAEQVLISFNCGEAFDNTQIHLPATVKQASFTRKQPNTTESSIIDTVVTPEGSFALLSEPKQGESGGLNYRLYPLRADLQLTGTIALPELKEGQNYTITEFRNGFLVYDSTEYRDLLYFPSSKEKPVPIEVSRPKDSSFKPYALAVRGESIVIAYSNNTEGEVADIHSPDTSDVKNEIHVQKGNQSRVILINKQFSDLDLCAEDKLCLLSGNDLEVYSIKEKSPSLLHRVGGVETIHRSGDSLLLIRIGDVLDYDVEQAQGHRQYSYGGYASCGIRTDLSGYTLCLINRNQKKVALRINPSATNTDSIDKRVAGLLESDGVRDATANGKFIHVTPNLGSVTFQPSINGFGYDPEKKQVAATQLEEAITKLGIDRNVYSVISTIKL